MLVLHQHQHHVHDMLHDATNMLRYLNHVYIAIELNRREFLNLFQEF